jgi:hypothetical protein
VAFFYEETMLLGAVEREQQKHWNQMRYRLSTHFLMQDYFVPAYPRIFLA